VAPAKVRISCQAADWLGESDIAALHPYFQHSGVPAIVLLQKISEEEQRDVLAEQGVSPDVAGGFLSEARARGLEEFSRIRKT
jgi:hypothetical protein